MSLVFLKYIQHECLAMSHKNDKLMINIKKGKHYFRQNEKLVRGRALYSSHPTIISLKGHPLLDLRGHM